MSLKENAGAGAKNLEEAIYAFLKRRGGKLKALEIAKGVGLTRAKDVNRALYGLQEAGLLLKTGETPPLWSLAEPGGSAEVAETTNPSPTPSNNEIKKLLHSQAQGEGVTAKKLARDLNLPRKTVNNHLYEMLGRGEVEKISLSKDDTFAWKYTDEDGSKNHKKEESDVQNDSITRASDESSDTVASYSTGSRFLKDYSPVVMLSKGGYGYVYKAKHNLDKKYYAIKVVECENSAHEEDESDSSDISNKSKKALREVKALAHCHHPNIVRYFSAWTEPSCPRHSECTTNEEDESKSSDVSITSNTTNEEDESKSSDVSIKSKSVPSEYLYIQMEFCDGGTLTDWITKRNDGESRSKQEALDIFQNIVGGVEYIHAQGLIHRDLKPDNILFGSNGTVKIGDFGLVTTITDKNGAPVERSKKRGTPSYRSPEQENLCRYDEKVDIFALGLIFFELLWRIATRMELHKLWADLRDGILPEDFRREYTAEHALIRKMLSKTPEERPGAEDIGNNSIVLPGKNQTKSRQIQRTV